MTKMTKMTQDPDYIKYKEHHEDLKMIFKDKDFFINREVIRAINAVQYYPTYHYKKILSFLEFDYPEYFL